MFQKKQYHTKQERRRDRIMGIVVLAIFNALAFVVRFTLQTYAFSPRIVDPLTGEPPTILTVLIIIALALPWVGNLALIGYGLFFRSEMTIGVLTALVLAMIIPTFLMMLFVPACLVAGLITLPFWICGEVAGGVAFGIGLAAVCLYALYWFWTIILRPSLSTSWAYPEDNPETPREKAWVPVPDIAWESDIPEDKGGDNVA